MRPQRLQPTCCAPGAAFEARLDPQCERVHAILSPTPTGFLGRLIPSNHFARYKCEFPPFFRIVDQ
jgi:hypothetical protein